MSIWQRIKSIFTRQSPAKNQAAVVAKPGEAMFKPEWAAFVSGMIGGEFFAVFDSAKDAEMIYPGYRTLTKEQRVKVWVEFIKWVTYYECSWDPGSDDVDVGKKNDKDTWSVGLLQLSVVDQPNYGLRFGLTFEDLKNPIKNLDLGIRIMAKLIAEHGKVMIPKGEGPYWATLASGNKNQKIAQIVSKVKRLEFGAPQPAATDSAPWVAVAKAELGVSETGNPKRILEYHAATSLHANSVKTAWCSSFANWCLKRVGIKGTNSAWARDWLGWGVAISEPVYGCIAVYERNGPGGDSHVAFWLGHVGEFDRVINGNVGDKVCESLQPKAMLLGYRMPKA